MRDPPGGGARTHPPARDAALKSVLALADQCGYDREHTHQVTRVALKLFDDLKSLHRMGPQERFSLQCGALLHDIGWCEGQKGHHKTAMRIILAADGLRLNDRRRAMVAQIARYHRKAPPKAGHAAYQALSAADRRRVDVLAGILRVADGLDRSHESLVGEVVCKVTAKAVTLCCRTTAEATLERLAATKKADLFEAALGRKLVLRFAPKC